MVLGRNKTSVKSAITIMKAMETILTNHVYVFDNISYKQLKGGPIGDNITNLSAKLVMNLFSVGYKRRLEKLDILKKTVLLKIYVDDLNQAGWCLPLGTFYKDGKMFVPKVGWRGRFYQGKKLSKNETEAIMVEAIRINYSNHTRDEREAWSAGIYKQIAKKVMPD